MQKVKGRAFDDIQSKEKNIDTKKRKNEKYELISKRNLNLDLIRCVAIFLVISVHFLLNTSFYSTVVNGKKMFLLIVLRVIFMSCVPLFMILTGYLMNKKEPTKEYYKKISKVAVTYVICSLLCILFRILYKGESFSFPSVISSILKFSGCGYAWYIEMYLGLYIIIPFLNKAYNSCKDKKEKRFISGNVRFFDDSSGHIESLFQNISIILERNISDYILFCWSLLKRIQT